MKDLLILHGAIGASAQFDRLADALSNTYTVHRFNFEGHGGRSTSQPYSIELFSQNLIDFIEEKGIESPLIFGYSMGGYVTLHAMANGLNVERLMTLGTKFNWSPEGAKRETKFLVPEVIEEKIPTFATYQAQLHTPLDWKEVMRNTADMMIRLGDNPLLTNERLSTIQATVLCTVGGKDNMVTQEETKGTVEALPNGTFQLFEGFEHPIEKVNIDELASAIKSFLV